MIGKSRWRKYLISSRLLHSADLIIVFKRCSTWFISTPCGSWSLSGRHKAERERDFFLQKSGGGNKFNGHWRELQREILELQLKWDSSNMSKHVQIVPESSKIYGCFEQQCCQQLCMWKRCMSTDCRAKSCQIFKTTFWHEISKTFVRKFLGHLLKVLWFGMFEYRFFASTVRWLHLPTLPTLATLGVGQQLANGTFGLCIGGVTLLFLRRGAKSHRNVVMMKMKSYEMP